MSILEAIILGLVQGLTEFIPISSTAHLRIVPALLGWKDPGAAVSAVIQLGTLLAVVIYFFPDLIRFGVAWLKGIVGRNPFEHQDSRMAWFIIIGSVPVVFFGLLFKNFIEGRARNLWIIATSLIVLGILLFVAERFAAARPLKREENELTMRDAVGVGLGQAMALVPGVSRSGSTIMVGLFRGLSHAAAARFSFLLSIPAIAGSGFFELIAERQHLQGMGALPILVSVAVSFFSGYASIWFLIRYLRRYGTEVFIYYRVALGLVIFVLLASGRLSAM